MAWCGSVKKVQVHFSCKSCHWSEGLEGWAQVRRSARVCTHGLSGVMAFLGQSDFSHGTSALPDSISGSCKTSYNQALDVTESHFSCILLVQAGSQGRLWSRRRVIRWHLSTEAIFNLPHQTLGGDAYKIIKDESQISSISNWEGLILEQRRQKKARLKGEDNEFISGKQQFEKIIKIIWIYVFKPWLNFTDFRKAMSLRIADPFTTYSLSFSLISAPATPLIFDQLFSTPMS